MGVFKKILKKLSPLHHLKMMDPIKGPLSPKGKFGKKIDPVGRLFRKSEGKPIGGYRERAPYRFE